MDSLFYWIGVVCTAVLATGIGVTLVFLAYVFLIHERFNVIFFRKGQRRISLASWHSTKLVSEDAFDVDDFLINERPFYLSYKIGNRRAFIMLGLLNSPRYNALWGKHPEYPEPTTTAEGD